MVHSKSEPFEIRTLKCLVLGWRSVFRVWISSPHCIKDPESGKIWMVSKIPGNGSVFESFCQKKCLVLWQPLKNWTFHDWMNPGHPNIRLVLYSNNPNCRLSNTRSFCKLDFLNGGGLYYWILQFTLIACYNQSYSLNVWISLWAFCVRFSNSFDRHSKTRHFSLVF